MVQATSPHRRLPDWWVIGLPTELEEWWLRLKATEVELDAWFRSLKTADLALLKAVANDEISVTEFSSRLSSRKKATEDERKALAESYTALRIEFNRFDACIRAVMDDVSEDLCVVCQAVKDPRKLREVSSVDRDDLELC
jgi:hypothetical protein